jgi:hypothetical protein
MIRKMIAASFLGLIPLVLLPANGEDIPKEAKLPDSTNGELQRLWKMVKPYKHTQCFQNMQGRDAYVGHIDWLPGIDRLHPEGNRRSNTHEFPWVHTAGFERGSDKYVHLPSGEHIEYTDRSGRWPDHGDVERVVEWRFPPGTVFVETLKTHGRIFEVRTRTKGGKGEWRANVYRSYADASDLQTKLQKLGTRDARRLALSISDLPRSYLKITDPHDKPSFEFKGYREDLPDIPESLAETILSWDFVANAEWKTDCFAPSTKSDSLSIVSKDYLGCIVRPDSKGCMQCHDSTQRHAFTLERNRDWYGRIRGSDGIFSFHIFANTAISVKGMEAIQPISFNADLPLRKVEQFSATHRSATFDPKP